MSDFLNAVFTILVLANVPPVIAQVPVENPANDNPVKIIFETDMCTDVDDVGALATLHALVDLQEAEILAVGYNEVHPNGAAAIDAINTWYGRGNIPIGVYKRPLRGPDESGYLLETARFPNDLPTDPEDLPSAVDVYVQVLNNQPDSSVTIVSVGFLSNLADLLDGHSGLISRKVKKLVIMGGLIDDAWNLVRHDLVETSQKIFEGWPTPIVISQEGADIRTGQDLQYSSVDNPVRASYYHYFGQQFDSRSSWDQMAVLFAVRGLKYFELHSDGSGKLSNGFVLQMEPGWRSYLTNTLSNREFEDLINQLMTNPPAGR
ncbi:MAG: nucleoside hydrolase [Saprospiraceae bacterium]|nr:nucleoside hydrolase [Saprospiraceae bacterium]